MPQIVFGKYKAPKIDSSIKNKAYAFLEKLSADDTTPGLHIEPITHSADPRARTGRVDKFWRAVLFQLHSGGEATYVYVGVYPHDDAIELAKKVKLNVNPVNGIAEIIEATAPVEPAVVTPPASVGGGVAGATSPTPVLRAFGYDRAALVDELGIAPDLATAALDAATDDALLDLVAEAPQWQGLALLDLAAGKSLAEVKEGLGIGPREVVEADEDSVVVEALRHPAARMQFSFIEDDDELRRAIDEADFGEWRLFLHPEQRKYATLATSGPFRLSGGAGTGKTVVLIHRARYLARSHPGASIVLTTFTKTLADQLRDNLRRLDPSTPIAQNPGDPGVHVTGIDSLVNAVLKRAQDLSADVATVLGDRSPETKGRTDAGKAWREAIEDAGGGLPKELRSPAFFVTEYAMVVLPARLISATDYFRARRPGRGVALDRTKRVAVWDVIDTYRRRAGIDGSIDFQEAAAIAAAALERTGAIVDHVLVDEGQDLNPSHWQFLRALVKDGPDDLFIAEDSHQRIYGERTVLGRYGIRIVGRSRRLTLNYRTTAQNLGYAIGILSGGDYIDLESGTESSKEYRSARSGPPPRLVAAESVGEELDETAQILQDWIESGVAPETIGILVRAKQLGAQVVRGLEERGVRARFLESGQVKAGDVLVMTMHRAKGMEFSRVVLFDVNDEHLPAKYLVANLGEADKADVMLRERSLLYVASTRARDELVVVWSGSPSEMLPAQH